MKNLENAREEFEIARAKREYEKTRLPEPLQERVRALESEAERVKEITRNDQAGRRDREIEQERARILREEPSKTFEYTPWLMQSHQTMKVEELDALVERTVDHGFAKEIAGIDAARDAEVDKVIALNLSDDRAAGNDVDLVSMRPDNDLSNMFQRSADIDLGPQR